MVARYLLRCAGSGVEIYDASTGDANTAPAVFGPVSYDTACHEIVRLHLEPPEPVVALDKGAIERAEVVAWLEMVAEDTFCKSDPEYGAIMDAAAAIARGEHAVATTDA